MSEIKLKPIIDNNEDKSIDNELLFDDVITKNNDDLSFLKQSKKVNISVALDEDVIKKLKLFAKRHKATRSISKIVQKAVEDFLSRNN
ncbi:hypothetical protein J6P52_06370 [bacterium]|nr:hypothetical protein [bacterium]